MYPEFPKKIKKNWIQSFKGKYKQNLGENNSETKIWGSKFLEQKRQDEILGMKIFGEEKKRQDKNLGLKILIPKKILFL